jgi:hypothetical protein
MTAMILLSLTGTVILHKANDRLIKKGAASFGEMEILQEKTKYHLAKRLCRIAMIMACLRNKMIAYTKRRITCYELPIECRLTTIDC